MLHSTYTLECTRGDLYHLLVPHLLAYLGMPITDYWELAVPSATPEWLQVPPIRLSDCDTAGQLDSTSQGRQQNKIFELAPSLSKNL